MFRQQRRGDLATVTLMRREQERRGRKRKENDTRENVLWKRDANDGSTPGKQVGKSNKKGGEKIVSIGGGSGSYKKS